MVLLLIFIEIKKKFFNASVTKIVTDENKFNNLFWIMQITHTQFNQSDYLSTNKTQEGSDNRPFGQWPQSTHTVQRSGNDTEVTTMRVCPLLRHT